MMYQIEFTEKALKQISKLEKEIQKRILNSLERIRIRPESYVTQLVGEPYYKLRVGDYRLIIDIQNDRLILLVVKVGHRKNIYKEL
ncbi:type II toxin-antitoxin system RelE/ParE family toxin [Candidatus Woesearchaeota archaeon]|nr:type II toxin-antitoxin system RelE/ParE family toxin [Candidatus Woesearchaeota archaeon]